MVKHHVDMGLIHVLKINIHAYFRRKTSGIQNVVFALKLTHTSILGMGAPQTQRHGAHSNEVRFALQVLRWALACQQVLEERTVPVAGEAGLVDDSPKAQLHHHNTLSVTKIQAGPLPCWAPRGQRGGGQGRWQNAGWRHAGL